MVVGSSPNPSQNTSLLHSMPKYSASCRGVVRHCFTSAAHTSWHIVFAFYCIYASNIYVDQGGSNYGLYGTLLGHRIHRRPLIVLYGPSLPIPHILRHYSVNIGTLP